MSSSDLSTALLPRAANEHFPSPIAQPNHSLVPTRLPPQGERALASQLSGHRIAVVPVTPRGHPGLPA